MGNGHLGYGTRRPPPPEGREVFVSCGGGGVAGLAVQEAHRRAVENGARLVVVGSAFGDEAKTREVVHNLVDRPDDLLEVRVDLDDPSKILEEAGRRRATLVVLGAATGLAVRRRTNQFLRGAPSPTLVARSADPTGSILVATDLSDPRYPALKAAAREHGRRLCSVVALHCTRPPLVFPGPGFGLEWSFGGPIDDEETSIRTARSRLKKAADQAMLRAELEVAEGPPGSVILEWVRRIRPALLIVGHHPKGRWRRWLEGSVSERLAAQVSCSVLVERLGYPEQDQAAPRKA